MEDDYEFDDPAQLHLEAEESKMGTDEPGRMAKPSA